MYYRQRSTIESYSMEANRQEIDGQPVMRMAEKSRAMVFRVQRLCKGQVDDRSLSEVKVRSGPR